MGTLQLKIYFIFVNVLAAIATLILFLFDGIYKEDVIYIGGMLATTSTLYSYVLIRRTSAQKTPREIGWSFIFFLTLWLFVFLILISWDEISFQSNEIDSEVLYSMLGGLEVAKIIVLATMMPKIFPDR